MAAGDLYQLTAAGAVVASLSSALMMNISSNAEESYTIKIISLIISIVAFILSASREYLNYARRFQSHDLSSKLYTTVLRSTEVRLIKNHIDRDEKRDIFKDIVDQMTIIEQYETPIPDTIEKQVRRAKELAES